MPAVRLDRSFVSASGVAENGLPEVLHTPAGLAILEIQGTIHAPLRGSTRSASTQVGRLEFPLYQGNGKGSQEATWMKKVYLYIGKHQRLTGEIKKLAKPLVVLDTSAQNADNCRDVASTGVEGGPQLNILAIIKHKILFSSRPEPVGM